MNVKGSVFTTFALTVAGGVGLFLILSRASSLMNSEVPSIESVVVEEGEEKKVNTPIEDQPAPDVPDDIDASGWPDESGGEEMPVPPAAGTSNQPPPTFSFSSEESDSVDMLLATVDVFHGVVLQAVCTEWMPKSYLWFVQAPDRSWLPSNTEEGGRKVRFQYDDLVQPGKYDVLLVCIGVGGEATQAIGHFEIGDIPDPPNPPDPPDPPDIPDGIGLMIYELARAEVDQNRWDLVFAWGDEIAGEYRKTAKRISDGDISDPKEIVLVQKIANRAAVVDSSVHPDWSKVFQGVAVFLDQEFDEGKLGTPETYVEYWGEVAEAMDALED